MLSVVGIASLQAQGNVNINEEIISDYFNASLTEDFAGFEDGSIIPVSEIAPVREKIWELWKKSVDACDEEKLRRGMNMREHTALLRVAESLTMLFS